jgi:2-aminoadipate transaminase
VVEDDPYGELRFAGDPLPSLVSLGATGPDGPDDADGLVVRLGSASKVLAPGLRVGWMTGCPRLLDAAATLKQSADLHTAGLSQLVVAELLADERAQSAHVDAVRSMYATRADALAASLRDHLGDRLEIHPVRGGMFLWARALDGTDTVDLLPVALGLGVAYVPGSAFSVDGEGLRDSLRLSFATNEPDLLDTAVGRLATAWGCAPISR